MRQLRRLGLAATAMLVLAGLLATAAQAAGEFTSFNTELNKHEKSEITGVPITPFVYNFTSNIPEVKCESTSTVGESATGKNTELLMQASYSGCTTSKGQKVEINMNGCEYRYIVGERVVENMEYKGTVNIVCPAGKVIEVVILNGATVLCKDTIAAQNGVGPIIYKTDTTAVPTDVEVVWEATNVVNTTDDTLINCGVTKATHNSGNIEMTETFRATNATERIDLTVMG